MSKFIKIQNIDVTIKTSNDNNDFICLTDMAKLKNPSEPDVVVSDWMRTRYTIDFLGIWERIYNPDFNPVEFEGFKKASGENSFTLSPTKWIKSTNAIGLTSKSGRYGGGTFAHRDIAFEFASWLSPEFKLYLIKNITKRLFTQRVSLLTS